MLYRRFRPAPLGWAPTTRVVAAAAAAATSTGCRAASTAPPSASSGGASLRTPSSTKATSTVHAMSARKGDATAGSAGFHDDVPSYSSLKHNAYLLLHGRRMWLPAALYAMSYAVLGPASPSLIMGSGAYLTACVLLQRWSIRGRTNTITKDLRGYTCVVTGGTSGIGMYSALQLLNMGGRVIIASKAGKEDATMAFFTANYRPTSTELEEAEPLASRVSFVGMDYHDQAQVVSAAARIKALCGDRVDLLVNCAGIWRETPAETQQHVEQHIGINFLGPFHLTEALLPSLRRASHRCGRVVYVTCAAHNGVRRPQVVQERMQLRASEDEGQLTARCYSASKLGNIYHAQSIAARRYEGIPINKPMCELHPVDACCADPGFCSTGLQREGNPLLGRGLVGTTLRSLWAKNALEGSQTVINACLREDVENGGYYAECMLMPSGLSKRAQDERTREEVVRWAMAKTIAKYYTTASSSPSSTTTPK